MVQDRFDKTPSPEQPDRNSTSETPPRSKSRIVVIGGINMDLVVRAQTMPLPGQTVKGHSFATFPGGKGANQAVAALRAGAEVNLIARTGNDDLGQRLVLGLKTYGVNTTPIMITEAVPTGIAMIIVDDNGENSICAAGGANLHLRPEDMDENLHWIQQADAVIMQMEIPLETVIYALQTAKHHGVQVILNPAPIPEKINPSTYEADILICNQMELSALSQEPVTDIHSAKLAASSLVAKGTAIVVVTMGRRGAIALHKEEFLHIPAFNTSLIDTTGAGDAFCGAFATAWSQTKEIHHSLRFATAAASLACSRFGAQPSMPHRDAIETLLKRSC